MFLLQSVPFAVAFGGEIRWQAGGEHGLLPAYLLATLDYSRDRSAEERVKIWRQCLDKLAMIPAMHEQLMLRLEVEAHRFSPDTLIDLLERSNHSAPTKSTGDIINQLWVRADRRAIQGLASSISDRWGGIPGLPLELMQLED